MMNTRRSICIPLRIYLKNDSKHTKVTWRILPWIDSFWKPHKPTGDQPQAIEQLVKRFKEGNQCQTLLGVTGSGKTFTMANVIQQLQKPTLVIAHNKHLLHNSKIQGDIPRERRNVNILASHYDYLLAWRFISHPDIFTIICDLQPKWLMSCYLLHTGQSYEMRSLYECFCKFRIKVRRPSMNKHAISLN